jgi:hypothetical protein
MIYPMAGRLRVLQDASNRTPNHINQVIHKLDIADNVTTPLFTITTINEAGSTDGGAYLCQVTALIAHAGTSGSSDAATKAYHGRFTRAMTAAGTGTLSAVVEDHDDTAADTTVATRSIGNVTLTITETSEYLITASITIDLSGTDVQTAEIVAHVELLWTGFTTTPEIAPA